MFLKLNISFARHFFRTNVARIRGCSENNASGLITLITMLSGMLRKSVRYVLKELDSIFPMIPSIAQRHFFLLSYNAFYLVLPVRVIQVENCCKHKSNLCQLFVHRCLKYPFKVRWVVTVIDSFFAEQIRSSDEVFQFDVNAIFKRP